GEHSEANDVIQFTVTSERNLMSILETVNWVDSMVCRLDVRPLAELQIPQMKRGLFGKRPFDWFEEHLKDCDILCYLGIHPYLGIDVKSCRVSFPDLWSLMAPTCVQLGVNITKADLQGTEGEMGNTAGPRQELLP
ncbi:MAG TPA: hypothetical protein VKI17_02015, partial [Gemmataceae bacterium]|nr:hypothetical protein [Gemmataceae bacterium]